MITLRIIPLPDDHEHARYGVLNHLVDVDPTIRFFFEDTVPPQHQNQPKVSQISTFLDLVNTAWFSAFCHIRWLSLH